MKSILSLCLILGVLGKGVSQKRYSLVITNANIVDVVNGKILPNRLIAISGNTIEAVDDTRKAAAYKADRYFDAKGRYVMPGLWDMHIHLRGGDQTIEANKKLLKLFLAYGVTTVRECGGDITPEVMQWRAQTASGQLVGPRIFTSGPKLDGPGAYWAGSIPVVTPADVSHALDSLQEIHSDFVKIYDSKISGDAYLEIVRQAKKRGMKVTGHMPFSVEIKDAAALGMDGSEHMYYVFKGCSSREDSITNVVRQSEHTARPVGLYQALPVIYRTFDNAKAASLFRYLAEKHFTVTPTLFVSNTVFGLTETEHDKDSLLPYIDPKIVATYAGRVMSARMQPEAFTRFMAQFDAACAALVPKMYAAGINIIAGSDCGAFNSYVYPGSSIHEEIKLLVASGLTPAQGLRTAVVNGAKFMGVQDRYGALTVGKCSDLVVLNGDPLSNIDAIDGIDAVVSHGKIYSRSALDGLLASIRN